MREDLASVVARIDRRVARLLQATGIGRELPIEDRSNECPVPTALESCLQLGLRGGAFGRTDEGGGGSAAPRDPAEELFGRRAQRSGAAEAGGFNLQAQA